VPPLRSAFVQAGISLAFFGMGRLSFNLLGFRAFGAAAIGRVNVDFSWWTLVAVVFASVPALVAGKYVAQYLGAQEPTRASRVLGACLLTTWLGAAAFLVCWLAYRPSELNNVVSLFGVVYSTYLVTRSASYAHQQGRRILIAEVSALAVLLLALAAGILLDSVELAAAGLVLQPGVSAVLGLAALRGHVRFRGAWHEIISNKRAYLGFSSAAWMNAMTGLASYHLAIVLAGYLLPDATVVGQLSLLLSVMSPLNLVPQAVGSVLFVDFARRHGADDKAGQRRIALKSTVYLQVLVLFLVGLAMLCAPLVFSLIGLVMTPDLVRTWNWLVFALGLTIVSVPCGHLLNATTHVGVQARASIVMLMIGVAIGSVGMISAGVVGAGWMRFSVDGLLAWTRMVIAERQIGWTGGRRADVVAFAVCFSCLFLAGFLPLAPAFQTVALVLGLGVICTLARREIIDVRAAIQSLTGS
jgi:O-antigen/teichoic acid export membrane protein